MANWRRIITLGALSAAFIVPAGAHAATVVNVSSSASAGATVFLDAGSYLFNFIGERDGGAYDGFSYWADSPRWSSNVSLDLGNSDGAFNRTNTLYFSPVKAIGGDLFHSNAATAGAHAASAGSFSFVLNQAQSINFFVADSVYGDNRGGVSLAIASSQAPVLSLAAAVPEPSSWAFMIVGFGIVGAACRRARQRSAVPLAR